MIRSLGQYMINGKLFGREIGRVYYNNNRAGQRIWYVIKPDGGAQNFWNKERAQEFAHSLETSPKLIIEPTTCPDCLFERKEYGTYRCAAHYDPAEDNARAIAQTGIGVPYKATKVQAIADFLRQNGGSATWKEIYENIERFYKGAKASVEWQAGIRGVVYREMRNERTFKMAGPAIIALI